MCRSKSNGGRRCTGHTTTATTSTVITNIASGNDTIGVQVGQIVTHDPDTHTPAPSPAPAPASTDPGGDDSTPTVVNIRSGNARVGMQTDAVHGGITIRF
jgi:hypothetical protein